MCHFGALDLFMLGLGADITGAYVLAKGLLTSPSEQARRARSYYDVNPPLAIAQVKDRLDGEVGVCGLGLGFLAQAAGYAIDAGGYGNTKADIWTVVGGCLSMLVGSLIVLW